jgi:hypothetical protein
MDMIYVKLRVLDNARERWVVGWSTRATCRGLISSPHEPPAVVIRPRKSERRLLRSGKVGAF